MTQKRINTIEEKIKKLWEKGKSKTGISERERKFVCCESNAERNETKAVVEEEGEED
jgi:actin-like ATPase involved in cell morphogenesis